MKRSRGRNKAIHTRQHPPYDPKFIFPAQGPGGSASVSKTEIRMKDVALLSFPARTAHPSTSTKAFTILSYPVPRRPVQCQESHRTHLVFSILSLRHRFVSPQPRELFRLSLRFLPVPLLQILGHGPHYVKSRRDRPRYTTMRHDARRHITTHKDAPRCLNMKWFKL